MPQLLLTAKDEISPKLDKIDRKFDKTTKSAKKFNNVLGGFKGLGLNALTSSVGMLTSGFKTLFSLASKGALALAADFIAVNKQFEDLQIMLNTAFGGVVGGAKAFEDVLKLSVEMPFSIDSITDSAIKLKTAGLDPMGGILVTLADSVAAFGGGSEQLKLVTIAIQQMVGKGVISMEELRRQFGEQVPTAMRAMAAGVKMSMLDMVELISKGGLDAKTGIMAMTTELDKLHGGAAKKRMESFTGAVTYLRNQWMLLLKAVGDGNGSFKSIQTAIRAAADALGKFREEGSAGAKLIEDISESIATSMKKFSDDPKIFEEFFKEIGRGIATIVDLAESAYEVIQTLVRSADALNVNKSINLKRAGVDTLSIDTSDWIKYRAILTDIAGLQALLDKQYKELGYSAKAFGLPSFKYNSDLEAGLPEAVGLQQLEDKLKGMVDGLAKDLEETTFNATLEIALQDNVEEVNAKVAASTAEAVKAIEHPFMTLSKNLAEATIELNAQLDESAKIVEKNALRIIELDAEIIKSKQSLKDSLRVIDRGGMTEAEAYRDILEEIEENKQAAAIAGDEGNTEAQVKYLEKAKNLVESLNTTGIENVVSQEEVDKAKALADKLGEVAFGRKGTYDDMTKWQEANDDYLDMLEKFRIGEMEVVSAEEQRRIKSEELIDVTNKLIGVKEQERDKAQAAIDEEKRLVDELKEKVINLMEETTKYIGVLEGVEGGWANLGETSVFVAAEMTQTIGLALTQAYNELKLYSDKVIEIARKTKAAMREVTPGTGGTPAMPVPKESEETKRSSSRNNWGGTQSTTINNNINYSMNTSDVANLTAEQKRLAGRA